MNGEWYGIGCCNALHVTLLFTHCSTNLFQQWAYSHMLLFTFVLFSKFSIYFRFSLSFDTHTRTVRTFCFLFCSLALCFYTRVFIRILVKYLFTANTLCAHPEAHTLISPNTQTTPVFAIFFDLNMECAEVFALYVAKRSDVTLNVFHANADDKFQPIFNIL